MCDIDNNIRQITIIGCVMKYTLHTHTVGFDGRYSVQAMVDRARDLGFKTIGISNHFIVNPIIKKTKMYPYAVRGGYSNIYAASFEEVLLRFVPHYREVRTIQELNPDMKILCGMEVDFFPHVKWLEGFENAIQILKPDYTIGSAHFVEYGGTLLNSHDWEESDEQTRERLLKRYWSNVAAAADSGLFTWLAHLDLPKKVGLGREDMWAEYENRAVESAANTNTAIEINTSFYRDYCYEPYPSNRILKMMQEHDVATIISDDAHEVKNIGRHFDDARKIIQDLNLRTYQH